MKQRIKGFFRSRTTVIAAAFLLLIGLGTLLLMLPAASKGAPATFLEALFTATSASCVTGLVVRDTFAAWTRFGQTIITVSTSVKEENNRFCSVTGIAMESIVRRKLPEDLDIYTPVILIQVSPDQHI